MIHHGDCLDVMAAMEPESVDAVVTDPPYGLEFMGKEWDKLGKTSGSEWSPKWAVGKDWRGNERQRPGRLYNRSSHETCQKCRKQKHQHDNGGCPEPQFIREWHKPRQMQAMSAWHQRWAEAAYRVAKPSAYLLAFGGTRTVHRMTVAIEDAGWIIRDMLVWAYASGFPKSKASLKPAWEPIVMARKPGPLRELAIDACRIGTTKDVPASPRVTGGSLYEGGWVPSVTDSEGWNPGSGRWPANVILTDPIFDGGWDGVVGGTSEQASGSRSGEYEGSASWSGQYGNVSRDIVGDSGTYSRFFLVPKADRADREPVITPDGHDRAKRFSTHPTVKPTDLMRHLVRLVTPTGGVVLDPFAGSGSTLLAAEMEGFEWIGIEKEAEYVAIAEARLNGTQRGLGLPA